MNNKLILLASFIVVFVLIAFLIRQTPEPITEQQVTNLSKVVKNVFSQSPQQSASAANQTLGNSSLESMIAIIYNRPSATWFFKARGISSLVDQRSQEFSQLFLDQLTWNEQGEPDLSHVPGEYQQSSQAAMRFATFNLKGLEVSVTRLGGKQSVEANITRWKRQLSLAPDAPQFVKFENNQQTVLVRLDQQPKTASKPQPPAKEKLTDFLQISSSNNWRVIETQSSMASATIELKQADKAYPVAVLRLPVNVPLETILGIWKERVGVAADATLPSENFESSAQQSWQLIELNSAQTKILLAMHQGDTRYTFLRLSSTETIDAALKQQLKNLLSEAKVIKP